MATQGKLGNLGEPRGSLLLLPEEQGYRLTKSPGAGRELPAVSEPLARIIHERREEGRKLYRTV